jgi:hypothetical protein
MSSDNDNARLPLSLSLSVFDELGWLRSKVNILFWHTVQRPWNIVDNEINSSKNVGLFCLFTRFYLESQIESLTKFVLPTDTHHMSINVWHSYDVKRLAPRSFVLLCNYSNRSLEYQHLLVSLSRQVEFHNNDNHHQSNSSKFDQSIQDKHTDTHFNYDSSDNVDYSSVST